MAKHKRLKPIGEYLYDKGEMIEQMFSSIPIVEIRNMVPIKLQGMPLHELKAECLVELLGMSDREILNILKGKKERNDSSSDSEHEDAFVISDEEEKISEKRIKKEKKDSVRKIKTERFSSKKDGTGRSAPESSTSKMKRKSKEAVEVNSKKKKKKKIVDRHAVIPSVSRDASKVPATKKKKVEHKKDSAKRTEEDDVVVLDDDSDQEEKREEKSLLDLLELEMRARAIRSLLKKEEAVQAQKVLSEYKDEPDDLIPIDIEPPQIELLSDSEGEETTNATKVEVQENADGGISSNHPEDSLHGCEEQELCCRIPDGPSVPATEKVATNDKHIPNAKAPKSTNKAKDMGDGSGSSERVKEYEQNENIVPTCNVSDHDDGSIQSTVSSEIIPDKVAGLGESSYSTSHCSISSKQHASSCASKDKTNEKYTVEQDTNKIRPLKQSDDSKFSASPSKDHRNQINTGNFLVVEEPSDALAAGGSQIGEPSCEVKHMAKIDIDTLNPPSVISVSDEVKITCSNETVDSSTLYDEFSSSTMTENPHFRSQSDVGNEKSVFVESSAAEVVPRPKNDGSDCGEQVKEYSFSNPEVKTPTVKCESSVAEEDLRSHFDEEVLDYDYDPVNSYGDKGSVSSVCPLETSTDCRTLPLSIGDYSSDSNPNSNSKEGERKVEKLQECSYCAKKERDVRGPGISSRMYDGECEISDEILVHSSDGPSILINLPLREAACDNGYVSKTLAQTAFKGNSGQLLHTGKLNGVSSEFSEYPEPVVVASLNVSDTSDSFSVQPNMVSNGAKLNFTMEEADPQKSIGLEDTCNFIEDTNSCLSVQSLGVVEKNECWKEVRPVKIPEEQAALTELKPIQLTAEEELASQSTVFNSGSEEPPKNGVPDVGLVSDVDKEEPFPIIKDSSATRKSGKDGRSMPFEPSLPIWFADESDPLNSAVKCTENTVDPKGHGIADPPMADMSPKTSDEIVEVGQSRSSSVIGTCTLKNSNTTGMTNDIQRVEGNGLHETYISTPESYETHPKSQDLISVDVIDITEGDHIESSDVVYVSEKRVDSDSIDESGNEISDEAASILAQMNTILNDEVDCVSECSSGKSCQRSAQATCDVPAEVHSVNSCSGSSGPGTDDGSPEKEYNTVVEVSDVDDTGKEESNSEGTSVSNDDAYDHEDVGDGSNGSLDNSCIEIIDDSESVCSVGSHQDGSISDDCVIVLGPQGSTADDCVVVKEPETSKNSDCAVSREPAGSESDGAVSIEPVGSESDDCAIVSLHNGDCVGESVKVSNCEALVVETVCLKSASKHSTNMDENNVMVTVIIEDDDGAEEEVQLPTEKFPAEILELDDDDEARANWTTRWLESDNVKKVVQTSKILTNVRKQMKMKLKKIEGPISSEPKPPKEKSAPALIGSVEEYHRLVKEGVIVSKVTQNDEKGRLNEDSNVKSIASVSTESEVKEQPEKQSERKKKSDKSERKNLNRPERKNSVEKRRNSAKCGENNFSKSVSASVAECSSSQDKKETDRMNRKVVDLVVGKDELKAEGQQDGEIIECTNTTQHVCVEQQKEESETDRKMIGKGVSGVRQTEVDCKKDAERGEREEGETSDKEEGEISSEDEGESKELHKSSQPELCSSVKTTGEVKEYVGSKSLLSCIPLPRKSPVKQQSTKTHERNSAAKRFILRNLQLGKKRPASSKNKRKRKKVAKRENKKGLGYSSNTAPQKYKPTAVPQKKASFKTLQSQKEVVNNLSSASNLLQAVQGVQPSYTATYSGVAQPGSCTSQSSQAKSTDLNSSNAAQVYDSYYSWAYSQGLTSSASGCYGYGTPESNPDPNVYKQWEEYYRKLMEACKVSAEHASAGTLCNLASTSEKSSYTWVFDHTTNAPQPSQVPACANPTAEPVAQARDASILSDSPNHIIQSVAPVTSEMSDKDRFESWQYRYGLKGLLKEHFIPAPTAPQDGSGSQKS